jgi:hypothetical protein
MVIVISPAELKAELPIVISDERLPNVSVFKLGVLAKAELSISVSMSGTAKARRALQDWKAYD